MRGRVVDIADDPDNAVIDWLAGEHLGNDEYQFHQPGDRRVILTVEVDTPRRCEMRSR